MDLKTYLIRHRKENRKKCSLEPLVGKSGFEFITYPFIKELPQFENPVLLTMDGVELTSQDASSDLILIDGTWKYASIIETQFLNKYTLPIKKRRLPLGIQTAYPRYQTGCMDPSEGLASIEALYVAYLILNRDVSNLLNNYYWKELFLSLNEAYLTFHKS